MRKKVLITGGPGFIGHHVIDMLLKRTDWDIVSLDRLDFSGNLNRLHEVAQQYDKETRKRLKVVFHDLKAEINPLVASWLGKPDIILHLAAASHVDRSITHPMEFVYDNIVGTANLLEYARRLDSLDTFLYFGTDEIFGVAPEGVDYDERARYNSTNPYSASKAASEELCVAYENSYKMPIMITHCHDSETQCWTEDGFKNVDDLSLGELVWTLKDNKELKLEPILEIVKNPYQGQMVNFKSTKYDLSVTPNHRMLTKKRGEKDFYIKSAEDMLMSKGRFYIPLTGHWDGECSPDFIDIGEYLRYDLHFNTKHINSTVSVDKFLRFIGWYVSEGFSRTNGSGMSISQKGGIDDIVECIENFGIECVKREKDNGVVIYDFISRQLQDFLIEQFGKDSYSKKIPSWIKKLDVNCLRVLFDTLIKGDGTLSKKNFRYYSVSRKLCEDVAEIGVKLGYSVSIKTRYTFNPLKTVKKESYYVSFSRNAIGGVDNLHKFSSYYNGDIWCIRTASGNFFVKRNGKISCSGNTMNAFGERQTPEKFIPLCVDRVNKGEKIWIHSNAEKTKAGSRFYIHAADIADAIYFLLKNKPVPEPDFGGARIPKFNIVGKEEVDNLSLAQMIADAQGKELIYEMVDFHSSRPGHDLRYSLSGKLMKSLGWEPVISLSQRIKQVSDWYLLNKRWLGYEE